MFKIGRKGNKQINNIKYKNNINNIKSLLSN